MSLILRCPVCEKHYEANDDIIKSEQLHCPLCGTDAAASDFSAMMFCPHCRGKLAVSLDMLTEANLSCPRCDKTFVPTVNISLDDDDDDDMGLFAEDEDEKSSFTEGDFFDKYKIIRLLGRGGMGEVYLAEHLFLHREVALKIMLSDVAKNSVFAKRFIREAKIANKIESPNLIGVFDVGIESQSEMLFIAMEYVNGRNVSEIIKEEGVLDEQTTLNIAYNVVNALEAMEKENVVHRDIKPSNIMIDVEGNIKLADLGIAKSNNHAEGDLTLTQESVVFGTPNYASPEQCRSSHNVDSRSDIYSLGATMYQMVSGEAPYTGETGMEIMLKVLGDTTPDFDKLSGLSAGFTALLYDMLQKDPAKRPQNIAELRERIENLMQGEKIWQYKLRIMLKKALPILKNIGLAILKAPLALLKKKKKKQNINDSALRHFFNFILFCIFIVLCGVLAYRHREYLTDRYIEYKNKNSNNFSAEQRRKYTQARTKLAKKRLEENIRKYKAKKAAEKTLPSKPVPVSKPAPAPETVKTDPQKLDSDGDGIPNFIELQHNLNPYDAADAKLDLDNDGISNLQEYKDGTLGKKNAPKNNAVNYNALAESEKLAKQEQDKQQTHSPKKQKFYHDSVEGRLSRCNDIIADLKEKLTAKSNDKWLKERLEYMQKVKNTVENQKKRYELAKQLKENNRFDDAATNEVKNILQALIEAGGYRSNRSKYNSDINRMMSIMRTRNIDPNMQITLPHIRYYSGPIFQSVIKATYYFQTAICDNITDILIKKHVFDLDIMSLRNDFNFLQNEKIIKKYLNYGIAEIDFLWYNIMNKMPHMVIHMIESGADVNKKIAGASILHWAVGLNDYATVKKLIMAGADINALDNNGETPLFRAEKYGNESVKKLLIALGSDTEYCNYNGKKASDYTYFSDFTRAVKKNDFNKITELLEQHPDLAHERLYDGTFPLHYAILKSNIALVKKLLGMNVTLNIDGIFSKNPVAKLASSCFNKRGSYAERNKNFAIYKLLLEAGAFPQTQYFYYINRYETLDFIAANYLVATAEHLKHANVVSNILRNSMYTNYISSTMNKNSAIRFRILEAMLKDGKWDLSSSVFNGVFSSAASIFAVQEKELSLLLSHKANVNDKNPRNAGKTALHRLCMESMRYKKQKRFNSNMPTLNDYVRRIRFLLNNGAEIPADITENDLPNDVKNILKRYKNKQQAMTP